MVSVVNKYADVRAATARPAHGSGAGRAPARLNLIVPKPGECVSIPEWMWREMRDGGMLSQYIAREKATMPRLIADTAKRERNFVQNNRSDFRRMASIPARLFFRWQGEDPDFWKDKKNLKRLKKDNPELAIWL